MSLVRIRNLEAGFGAAPLLHDASVDLESGERVCIVGRNGAGKSTLLKILTGEIKPDAGEVRLPPEARLARLTQEVPADLEGPVYDVVASGLAGVGELIARYHHLSHELAEGHGDMDALERVQHDLESAGGWEMHRSVETVISRLELDPEARFEALSGGLKRRVLLARALAPGPDLLLLDEPTNHLDLEAITWLEDFLISWRGTLIFISHDRAFVDKVATRILDLERGRLTSFPAPYATYLERKEALLANEARENAEFDKKLAQEETWIRQGIKARRTRNEGRVRALKALRVERAERRERMGTANMTMQEADRSGKRVIEAQDAGFDWQDKPIFHGLDLKLLRGDRVGIIGPNGSGKTTLLQVLLGDLEPTRGRVRRGTKLELAYFDQHRAHLDPTKNVIDNLAEGRETIDLGDQKKHVMGYLQDFLFAPDRVRQPVSALSGGERNRLLLAKLFTKPFNLLVMDEPTNDLDVETLELLEERLQTYDGTLLLVSHDRAFLNNVVTSTLVFEGDARVNEYVGGYDDWLRQRPEPVKTAPAKTQSTKPAPATTEATAPASSPAKAKPKKLSYKDQRELEALPARIEVLEEEQAAVTARMSEPGFYQSDKADILATQDRLAAVETELAEAYERWETLEG